MCRRNRLGLLQVEKGMRKIWIGLVVGVFLGNRLSFGEVWSVFTAPTVEHLKYSFSAVAGVLEQTLVVSGGGGETIIANGVIREKLQRFRPRSIGFRDWRRSCERIGRRGRRFHIAETPRYSGG